MLDKLISKLGANLDSLNIAIKRHTLRGLQVVGTGRTDVLRLILPKLIDEEVLKKRRNIWMQKSYSVDTLKFELEGP